MNLITLYQHISPTHLIYMGKTLLLSTIRTVLSSPHCTVWELAGECIYSVWLYLIPNSEQRCSLEALWREESHSAVRASPVQDRDPRWQVSGYVDCRLWDTAIFPCSRWVTTLVPIMGINREGTFITPTHAHTHTPAHTHTYPRPLHRWRRSTETSPHASQLRVSIDNICSAWL